MQYCIYIIDNTINSKIYIGLTNNFDNRKRQHWKGYGKATMPIDMSIILHGNQNFNMYLLEACESFEDMNEAEEFWIAYYKSIGAELYNLTNGGNNRKFSEETKAKISAANRGRKFTDEHKLKLSIAKLGKKQSEATKLKRSNSMIGKNKGRKLKSKNEANI